MATFKNYQRKSIRAITKNGFHSIYFRPQEEKEVPALLESAALAAGLVPVDELADPVELAANLKAAEENEAKIKKAEDDAAEIEAAKQLKDAASKATAKVNQTKVAAKK